MTQIPIEPTKSGASSVPVGYTSVAKCEDVPDGEGRSYKIGGKSIALFRVRDRFYAINNICPHQGASLGKGKLKGYIVSCPLHDQQFDVRSGFGPDGGGYCVVRYDVKVYDGYVWVNFKPKDWFSGE
ncbi:MAG: nitrite reductase (NAD(P)H) small subunit [Nitrospirales bacterium]|nr:nitrite reductase (NAD(P)H) small subunit [Nitrospira sp.]MCB9710652.1 nitrite reductase (NAD(P)H) small subunit [Nitrospiraceae bacterium]MDR4486877.1 nitrite reductase (NAD(P)H) small subunit [Nitrospirales bacterium]